MTVPILLRWHPSPAELDRLWRACEDNARYEQHRSVLARLARIRRRGKGGVP